jgi:rhodanese-related sulfurtransferase
MVMMIIMTMFIEGSTAGSCAMNAGTFAIGRLQPAELHRRLGAESPPLLLDVRRKEAFRRTPDGIPGAVPIFLDEVEPLVPDLARDTAIVTYCLCSGQASSTRVALWLAVAGYRHVHVLEGGLPAWRARGLPLAPAVKASRESIARWMAAAPLRGTGDNRLIAEAALLAGRELPLRRDMAVLFVDMVDSTRLLLDLSPEEMLAIVQAFMEAVVEISVQHCGDVHDFQGDGAMLYFAGPGEAMPAAFRLREPLAPPGGIVATVGMVDHARDTDPDLAARFQPLVAKFELKGLREKVDVLIAPAAGWKSEDEP